jgi:hypothetical protein
VNLDLFLSITLPKDHALRLPDKKAPSLFIRGLVIVDLRDVEFGEECIFCQVTEIFESLEWSSSNGRITVALMLLYRLCKTLSGGSKISC